MCHSIWVLPSHLPQPISHRGLNGAATVLWLRSAMNARESIKFQMQVTGVVNVVQLKDTSQHM